MLNLATIYIYHFTAIKMRKPVSEAEEEEQMRQLEDMFFEILGEMIDKIFGENSQIEREQFIDQAAG